MLISKVPDDDGEKGKGQTHVDDNTHEYQTANELFELMAKNQNFNASGKFFFVQLIIVLFLSS